jgi:hypothetical protein
MSKPNDFILLLVRGQKLLLVGQKILQNTLPLPIGLDNGNFGPMQQQTINTTI